MAGLISMLVTAAVGSIVVNRNDLGAVFDGLGGLSGGGATSRLLVDYKEPQRTQILDYLFKPNFGASLQILKVEIGGDSQSTDGTEPSHMHSKDDLDVTRGYEWWLMKEAKARNPEIKLYGLPWAFPGWVGNDPATGAPSGSPFTYPNQTSHYILEWLKGAKQAHGLDIDYIGVWNERSSTAAYAASLKQSMRNAGFDTKLIAKDDAPGVFCDQLKKDPEYAKQVDIVGVHYPSDYGHADYFVCHELGKPLWASEESSSYDDFNGAGCWARIVTSHYVLSGMTASIMWNLVGAYYHGTNWYASSMLTSVQPWSGYFENLEVLWATAHLTQFTKVGWQYLKNDHGSGKLPEGGFYVTLVDPKGDDFTMMFVKISWRDGECTRPPLPPYNVSDEVVTIKLDASMKAPHDLVVFRSNFENEAKPVFVQEANINIVDGEIALPVKVGDVITVSTVRTARKGHYESPPSSPAFPLPHFDDFEATTLSQEAPYCTDQIGSFEVTKEETNPKNQVMRQMVPQLPIGWSDHGSNGPMSLIGMIEWRDIDISIDFKVPVLGASGCIATRINQMWHNGIVLCADGHGQWNLSYNGPPVDGDWGKYKLVKTGMVAPLGVGKWNNLRLRTLGGKADGVLGGKTLFTQQEVRNVDSGFGGFGTNFWHAVEYDNLNITKIVSGDNWSPTTPSPCPAKPQVGQVLTVTRCKTNGIAEDYQSFDLTSDWQIIHRPTGLCVTAPEAAPGAVLTLQSCVFGNEMQQWTNKYTRIRDEIIPLFLRNTLVRLAGTEQGAATTTITGMEGVRDWATWTYFPNTYQLRNQYNTDERLGLAMCLTACTH
eukprot:TRINITY_DN27337_c0_g1_i1.p1 TRINITY_DN27337_c0_g1~~TRINITY_DN27337_c0_g1_i1.p1  ORF type:complete len:826 (+),score=211.85 TRINITY_DN27337_c0_g1_i1:46-2523(+)